MCHLSDYEHMIRGDHTNCTNCGKATFTEETIDGMCGSCFLAKEDAAERTSPWVKRNNDFAQYHQPRGSQYEG